MAELAKIQALLDQAEAEIVQRPGRRPIDTAAAVGMLINAVRALLVEDAPPEVEVILETSEPPPGGVRVDGESTAANVSTKAARTPRAAKASRKARS